MGMSLRTIERLVAKAKDLPEFQVSFLSDLFCFGFDNFFLRLPSEKLGPSIRSIQDTHKNELNMSSRRPAKKPLFTQKMKEKRIEFARTHADWTVDDWKKVHFTDESTFRRGTPQIWTPSRICGVLIFFDFVDFFSWFFVSGTSWKPKLKDMDTGSIPKLQEAIKLMWSYYYYYLLFISPLVSYSFNAELSVQLYKIALMVDSVVSTPMDLSCRTFGRAVSHE